MSACSVSDISIHFIIVPAIGVDMVLTILSNLGWKIVREVVCNLDLPKWENWSHHDVLALPKKEEKMEGNTYEILDGSCASVDIGLKLRRRPKRLQGCSPGNLNLATLSMESPQAESSAKRRRLTHREMHVAAWTEGSSSEKKESECEDLKNDRVKIKKEKVAEPIHVVGKDVQWLKAKKEIKDDMEQDMKSSNFHDVDDVALQEVEVKDEIENDEEDHDKSPQQSEVAVKQEVRRRLTRKVQVAAWTEASSSEKTGDDRAKIKMERVAGHEVSFASPLADADGHEDGRTHAHFSTLKREDPNPKKYQIFDLFQNDWKWLGHTDNLLWGK